MSTTPENILRENSSGDAYPPENAETFLLVSAEVRTSGSR